MGDAGQMWMEESVLLPQISSCFFGILFISRLIFMLTLGLKPPCLGAGLESKFSGVNCDFGPSLSLVGVFSF